MTVLLDANVLIALVVAEQCIMMPQRTGSWRPTPDLRPAR